MNAHRSLRVLAAAALILGAVNCTEDRSEPPRRKPKTTWSTGQVPFDTSGSGTAPATETVDVKSIGDRDAASSETHPWTSFLQAIRTRDQPLLRSCFEVVIAEALATPMRSDTWAKFDWLLQHLSVKHPPEACRYRLTGDETTATLFVICPGSEVLPVRLVKEGDWKLHSDYAMPAITGGF